MKKIRKRISKILVMLFSCLALGTVVNAAETASTEVQISIEGTETNVITEKTKSVKTGDNTRAIPYAVAGVAALCGIVGLFIWRKKWKGIFSIMVLALSLFMMNGSVYAAETSENVNVTIPSKIGIVFNEDGTNSVDEFEIKNDTNLPIKLSSICVTECNEWKLVSGEKEIPANTKEMMLKLEDFCVYSGENHVDISIPEQTKKALNIEVMRGAWTKSEMTEKAMDMEFVYEFQNKQFQIHFDSNGGNSIESIKAYNGEKVSLPIPEKEMVVFRGWQDEEGNVYKEDYIMPTKDVTLTALWNETQAYAIYSADDKSLTFVRSDAEIRAGSTYNGKTVTSVYAGIETASYTYNNLPWLRAGGSYGGNIKSVVVKDVIRPVSTAYWFFCLYDCAYMDLQKLDMSKVTDMTSMFSSCGSTVSDRVVITGLSNWDTSNVRKMGTAFRCVAETASIFQIDDISGWDTSNVSDMLYMFACAGMNADWSLNLSGWNVSNVVEHTGFNKDVQEKVVPPQW